MNFIEEDKVIEECAEVIHAIQKAKRFGYFTYHPDRQKSCNMVELQKELGDLLDAMSILSTKLKDIRLAYFKEELTNEKS